MENASPYSPPSWSDKQKSEASDTVFYTCLKQMGKTADFLNFRFKDGTQRALPCPSINGIEFDPGQNKILILCGFAQAIIEGRYLEELYKQLLTLRVTEVREYCGPETVLEKEECFITAIEYASAMKEEEQRH